MLTLTGSLVRADAFEADRLVCRKNSLYSAILVYQHDSVFTLRFGMRNSATVQSRVDVNDLHRHLLEYTRMTFCGLLYKSEPNAILVVGQGGGVIPREIRYYFPNAVIDIVEIDPDIPDIAQKYFAFSPDEKMRVHVDDGRMFIKKRLLKKHDGAYDWIILDAFNGDYIPFHLMTKEFLQEVKGILVEDGIVTANVFSSNRLFDAEWKTFLAVFKDCQVFVGSHSDNAILAASGNKGKPLDAEQAAIRADRLQNKHGFAFSLTDVAASLKPLERPDPKARVLTDDRAPVNWLKSQKRGVQ
jgi:spermidine synthase